MLLGSGNVLCVLWGWVKDDNLFNFSGVRYLDSTSLNKTEILTDLNFHFRGEGIHHKLTHNHHVHYHCDNQVKQAEYMDKSLFFFVINRSHHLLKCQVCAVGCDDHCCVPDDPCVNLHRPVVDWANKPAANKSWSSRRINGALRGKRYLSTHGQHGWFSILLRTYL